ncbi:NAD(P)-dependent oxidoreductase [Planotetraspora kaengkrachanensis]|uniref:NADH-flavin reductase n=1 Tax=Planotetraspora kaengkrachanensis TaxID=575193 RepID=A0A8J3LZ09_9ACTN|nr:NAD(P)H-binding protein [Planotetraspora kaengkrachanensis]GIG79340.1 NADH-flavin reductase [Planotetraspora kaengkrachanensis]
MRIIVFGATRGTGLHFVRLALAKGHEVVAVARRPEAVTERHPNLSVRQGDVLAPETLDVKGADVVVFLAGPSESGPTRLYSQGGRNVMDAMDAVQDGEGVRRLVVVTNALGDHPSAGPVQGLLTRMARATVLRHVHRDARLLEREIRGRDLDWTVIQPPRLTDRAATGVYRTAVGDCVRGGLTISREDLAQYVLAAVTAPETIRATVGIAH